MPKIKFLSVLMLIALTISASAQFMDPERKPSTKKVNQVTKNDEFFPEIIPEHGGGGKEVVELKEKVCALSNNVEKIESNLVNKLDNNTVAMTNSSEFVEAVRIVTPVSTNVWPKAEFEKAQASIAAYREAFGQITNVNVSAETNLEELKLAILKIRAAAQSAMEK